MKASFFKHVKMSNFEGNQYDEVINFMQAMEKKVDEMNQSFYDIVSDLEGKYSVHDKEIDVMESRFNDLNTLAKELATMLNYQGKEIASIKEEPKGPIETPAVINQTVREIPSERMRNKRNDQDDLKNEIIRLKALGLDDQQIARRLGKGVREIKMLMSFIK